MKIIIIHKYSIKCILLILLISLLIVQIEGQRTNLDNIISFRGIQRIFRKLVPHKTGEHQLIYDNLLKNGKLQHQYPDDVKFFCDTNNTRSPEPPKTVHELRPGDIDIIGAMGDSLTAGNGIMATNLLHINLENRGISWSGGGQDNWRKFLTIPNILKEFNPNLYGYSLGDSISTEQASMFNVAELGAMSRDTPYMAKELVKRFRNDPKVNMTHHWKLVTFFIGNNDFCSDICYYDQPEKVIQLHEKDLVQTLRTLRDNIPKLMVNLLPTPNLRLLTELNGKPGECHITHRLECPCLIGSKATPHLEYFTKIMKKWIQKEKEIVDRDEFNREDFTVNYQPFTTKLIFPKINDQFHDFRYLSTDCFHLSQKGQAAAANAMWNNMLEPEGEKSTNWITEFSVFHCPTETRPFLATRENSIKQINYDSFHTKNLKNVKNTTTIYSY